MEEPRTVQAAGCVLWRSSPTGEGIELALVFRPKWADWSHPKGKLKRGESARAGAVREVLEETGMTCVLGAALPTARYIDAQGRPKEVRYWAARAVSGEFVPNSETSRLVWLTPDDAHGRLTHHRDRELITFLNAALLELGSGEENR
ncbi:DNA mismatch repair protein MutT [Streptomyces eurocidicus]|uniref:8-oxo-dGTP diphosphatase n=1 Tax=Streptomyces eurocidicus TaxID=66423 RepID=A0A2N8NWX1_STREU|nr:NUDIX hydrolase [Streptomyces eurocidicus]MBB5117937.1 8-oxo-dGTP diphosphatase [Streptomyces eurocidicus]MBF6053918.1 NUDIX domain-containing protein [Streptomyces eurocidicus]PNE33256.1 DNA mismatch repair protein MutT [Streptomyces eurocidicus]